MAGSRSSTIPSLSFHHHYSPVISFISFSDKLSSHGEKLDSSNSGFNWSLLLWVISEKEDPFIKSNSRRTLFGLAWVTDLPAPIAMVWRVLYSDEMSPGHLSNLLGIAQEWGAGCTEFIQTGKEDITRRRRKDEWWINNSYSCTHCFCCCCFVFIFDDIVSLTYSCPGFLPSKLPNPAFHSNRSDLWHVAGSMPRSWCLIHTHYWMNE